MNCKPGDLAIVVRPPAHLAQFRGRVIQLTTGYRNPNSGKLCWLYEGPVCETADGYVLGWDDDELKPITPPDGSVTDKEVRELYAPSQEPSHV